MTDFDTRILEEDPKEPPLPATEAEREDPRRRIAARVAMETREEVPEAKAAAAEAGTAPLAAEKAAEAEREIVAAVPAPPDRAAVEEAEAARTDVEGAATGGERENAAPAPETEADSAVAARAQLEAEDAAQRETAAERATRARRRALTAALAALAKAPEDVRLAPLLAAYEGAPEAEVAQAAGALLTLYLRADTETRRRLRPGLAEALRRGGKTPLAVALSARLGAIAMPPPATPTPPGPDP